MSDEWEVRELAMGPDGLADKERRLLGLALVRRDVANEVVVGEIVVVAWVT